MPDPTDFSSFQAEQLGRPQKAPINLRFEKKIVRNEAKSLAAGHPVHDEIHYVYMRNPGYRDEFCKKVDEAFLEEFGPIYEKWKKTQEQPVDGLPLEQWPPIPGTLVEDWKFYGVRTVQQLAALSDSQMQKLGMGTADWRKKAQVWLEEASTHAASQRLAVENDGLKRDLEMLKQQLVALNAKADEAKLSANSVNSANSANSPDIAAITAAVMAQIKAGMH